jgi:hypothetical protein
MDEIITTVFPHYLGKEKWDESSTFSVTELNNFGFCNLCGKVEYKRNALKEENVIYEIGVGCGCINELYESLNKKYRYEKELGLPPGWIVLE